MSNKIHHPHDNLFLQMMRKSEAAKDFFRLHLPEEIKSKIDLNSLQTQSEVYTDATGRGIVDTLYSANIAGKEAYILLLCEHQATSQRLMPLRLVEYILRIIRDHLAKEGDKALLPSVYPLIFYTGIKKYRYSTDFWNLFEDAAFMRKVMTEPFRLVELMEVPDEALKTHPNSGLTEYVMKHRKDADIVESLARVPELLRRGAGDFDYFRAILCYTIDQAEAKDADELVALFSNAVDEEKQEGVMTIAEQLRQQGWQKGELEGLEKGLERGKLEGKLEGEREAKRNIATSLIRKGHEQSFIIEVTGLSEVEVAELWQTFAAKH